ncbi:unnamed protein product [Closterium sp. Naga37s-1]|nr:unnamed protein product [Closterium sp. Naga37s-1]
MLVTRLNDAVAALPRLCLHALLSPFPHPCLLSPRPFPAFPFPARPPAVLEDLAGQEARAGPIFQDLPVVELLSERVRKGALVEFEKEQQRHVVGVVMRPEGKKNWIVMDQVLRERVRKGALVEFEKEQQRHVVGVVMRPEGKKNWIVMDQNGNTFSVRPQQLTFVENGNTFSVRPQQLTFVEVGEEDFNAADLSSFLSSVDSLTADASLLEMVWEMFLSEQPTVTTQEFAEIAFGEAEDPLVPHFAAHRMLTADRIFFKRVRSAAHSFELRPPVQVEQLRKQAAAEAAVRAEQEEFSLQLLGCVRTPEAEAACALLVRAGALPLHSHSFLMSLFSAPLPLPPPHIFQSLQLLGCVRTPEAACDLLVRAGALPLLHALLPLCLCFLHPHLPVAGTPRLCETPEAACDLLVRAGALPLHSHSYMSLFPHSPSLFCSLPQSLQLLGCVRTPEAACDLLVRAGALPLHSLSFRLAASAMPGSFPASVADYSASLAANPPPDPDESIRVDLTHPKVYTIDSYDTVEVDDGAYEST